MNEYVRPYIIAGGIGSVVVAMALGYGAITANNLVPPQPDHIDTYAPKLKFPVQKVQDKPIDQNKRHLLQTSVSPLVLSPSLSPTPQRIITENTTDSLGYAQQSKKYAAVKSAGGFVLNVSHPKTFAVVWLPKTPVTRILILLHGTGGTAYEEVADELLQAQKHGYGLVGIQWFTRETNTYAQASVIYDVTTEVLNYLKVHKSLLPQIMVLHGFSRGSAISYEVTYLDHKQHHLFSGTAAMSGGIPADSIVEAKNSSASQDSFFIQINAGSLSKDSYRNHHFFQYCGMQDEQWGSAMCDQQANAKKLFTSLGGISDQYIADEHGKHMDFRTNITIRSSFITWFTSL